MDVKINDDDYKVLKNIAESNDIILDLIIGLLMDGFLDDLVKRNGWKCDYILKNGNPWLLKKEVTQV